MGEVLLSAKNLSVRFGGVLAVNNVSFDVKRGEVFTLIGPNGAGKTTVFNLISRIYNPTAGSIAFEGKPLTAQPPHRIASLGSSKESRHGDRRHSHDAWIEAASRRVVGAARTDRGSRSDLARCRRVHAEEFSSALGKLSARRKRRQRPANEAPEPARLNVNFVDELPRAGCAR